MIKNLSFQSKLRTSENLYPTLWACFQIFKDFTDGINDNIH